MRPRLNTDHLPFVRKLVSVATSQLRIFPHLLPFAECLALDVLGNQEVQLFLSYLHR
jgi:hypothetical protein